VTATPTRYVAATVDHSTQKGCHPQFPCGGFESAKAALGLVGLRSPHRRVGGLQCGKRLPGCQRIEHLLDPVEPHTAFGRVSPPEPEQAQRGQRSEHGAVGVGNPSLEHGPVVVVVGFEPLVPVGLAHVVQLGERSPGEADEVGGVGGSCRRHHGRHGVTGRQTHGIEHRASARYGVEIHQRVIHQCARDRLRCPNRFQHRLPRLVVPPCSENGESGEGHALVVGESADRPIEGVPHRIADISA